MRVLSRKEQLPSSSSPAKQMRPQKESIVSPIVLLEELQGFCLEAISMCMFLIIMYICLHIKLAETKDEPCTSKVSDLGEVPCMDLNSAHRMLLCCSQKHHFSTCRQTGISFNPVKLHGNRHQQSHNLSWVVQVWAWLLGFVANWTTKCWTWHAGDCSSSSSH